MIAGGLDGLGRMIAGGELGEPYRAAFELQLGPWAFGFVVLVADLAWRVRHEVRYVPAVSRTVATLAAVLAVGSWLSEISINVARWTGLVYPNDVDPAKVDVTTLPIDWAVRMQTLVPNWPLLGLAIVLGVLAYIIRAGERLQRDSEGLV
jgi:hypothetical protein